MNGLEKPVDKPYHHEIENKFPPMMYNVPHMDMFNLSQYAGNPNLAAAMHFQSQLHLMSLQQQNMLRMQSLQIP
jgi:hypothetical protein